MAEILKSGRTFSTEKTSNVSGKVVYAENKSEQNSGEYSITLPMEKFSNGIYFCRFTAGEITSTLKIVKTE